MVHSRNKSKDAAALAAANGGADSRPDDTGSGVVTTSPTDQAQIQAIATSEVVSTLTTQISTMQDHFNQQFANQLNMINTLIGSIQATHTQIATTTQSVSNLENQFSDYRNEASTFATDATIANLKTEISKLQLATTPDPKISTLEQSIKDLQLALPSTKKSFARPQITDVSTIVLPIQPTFELKSKTVKLKDLHNSLMALTFTSDNISAIKHMYARIRQAIDIGCNTSYLLPDIENETQVPDFFSILVPPHTDSFYMSVLASYKTISNALLTFFHRPETVTRSAPGVSQAMKEVESSSDGFIYLGTILHQLLPQFAGKPLSLIDELGSLFIVNGEEY